MSAFAIAIGDQGYFGAAEKAVWKTASGNTLVGVAMTAAANPFETVDVQVKGSF